MQIHTTRKRTALRPLLTAFLNVTIAFTAINVPAFAQGDQRNENGSQIEGSWILTNERVNQNGFTFTAVASFAAGGVWLAAGSIDPQNSALYGSWKRTRHNRYDSTSF